MRFGLGPFAAEQAGSISWMEAYEIMGEAARQADSSGFDSVWVAERQFSADGYCPQPFIAAADIAAKTEAIKIGVLPIAGLTHPLYLAEDAVTLDNISGGRAIVVPINAVSHERMAYGLSEDQYQERYRETIEVLLKAWTPQAFRHDGKHWTIPAGLPEHTPIPSGTVMLQPQSAQFELPLVIGGFWDYGRSLAAEMGLPMMLGAISDNASLNSLWTQYNATAPFAARRPKMLIRDVYVSTGEDPLSEIAEMVSYQFKRYADWGLWQGDASDVKALSKTSLIVGNPEQVIEQITALDSVNKLDHFICRMHFPGMPLHQLLSSMTLFSREVIPEFRMPDLPKQIRTGV
jgi:alkanesulfonate monooxygenase SsuD/methylene tetrahydromethanopterin reductase-like flavin-dependent oxidoreductase (luciferase family)